MCWGLEGVGVEGTPFVFSFWTEVSSRVVVGGSGAFGELERIAKNFWRGRGGLNMSERAVLDDLLFKAAG